jgi:hypothetical protein
MACDYFPVEKEKAIYSGKHMNGRSFTTNGS